MRKYSFKAFVSDILLGLGVVFIFSPLLLYWIIHGDYERYIWIIRGPYPFSSFGGRPFQLYMYVALFTAGAAFITISTILKRR